MAIVGHTFGHAYDNEVQKAAPLAALTLTQRKRDAIGKHGVTQVSDHSGVGGMR